MKRKTGVFWTKKYSDKERKECKIELFILLIMKRIWTTGYSPFAVFESFIGTVAIEGSAVEVFLEKFIFSVVFFFASE